MSDRPEDASGKMERAMRGGLRAPQALPKGTTVTWDIPGYEGTKGLTRGRIVDVVTEGSIAPEWADEDDVKVSCSASAEDPVYVIAAYNGKSVLRNHSQVFPLD
eukprot:ANDGO_00842.mRNA.1 hypothetical protein